MFYKEIFMLKDLVKVASRLNSLGLSSEANFIDSVVRKFAGENSRGRGPERVYDETPTRFNQALPLKAETEVGYDFIDPSEWTDQPGRKGGDWGPSKETEDAERIEGRHNKQYRRRDGGHSRGHGRGASEWDSLPLSDDARDGHRSSKYPPLEYDSEGRIIFPEDRPDFSGEPVTHFRRREPTGGGGRRIHVPSEAPSSYTGDEDLVIERLAKRLSSLGLTKEARILSSIIKSAGDDLDRELEEDQDPAEWTDKQWAEYESTAGPNGNGTRDIWEATSEDRDIEGEAERAGIMAWVDARNAGLDPMNCQAAYADAKAAYRKEFGTEESEF